MTPTHQYSRAPITEALIDIRVEASNSDPQSSFDQIAQAESKNYPNKHQIIEGVFQVSVDPKQGHGTSTRQKLMGIRLSDVEQKQLVQLRVNGLTFSRLNPYQGWHVFQPEARRLWLAYCEHFSPARILRVAVRYINRIDLPPGFTKLGDYLTTLPQLPDRVLAVPDKFFMQLQIPLEDIKATLVLTEAIAEPPPGKVSVVLDFDIFRDRDLPNEERELWELFELFHEKRNEVFEASITDNVRRLIDE